MSAIGPLGTYAGLLQRSRNLIEVYLRDEKNVVGYQFWGHRTVNGVYGNPAGSGVGGAGAAAMFTVNRGGMFRSPTVIRKGWGRIDESRRGTTRAIFDIEDFTAPGGSFPKDADTLFMRVQENRLGAGLLNYGANPADPVLGPIYMVPPAALYTGLSASFTLAGTAPSGTGSVAGSSPVLSEDGAVPSVMYLVFPMPCVDLTVRNLSGAADLLVALGPGQPMMTVPPNGDMPLPSGVSYLREVLLAASGAAGAAFSIFGAMTREK